MPENAIASQSCLQERRSAGATRDTAPTGLLRAFDWILKRYGIGGLHLTLPSGASSVVGQPSCPLEAHVALKSYGALWKLASRGALGFAESYMDGDFDTDDLRKIFEVYLANEPAITRSFPSLNDTRARDRHYHLRRRNTLTGSRRNIAAHYDLGNAFYRLWLDADMSYSSAIYLHPEMTLEEAQAHKQREIVAALELQGGDRLLEIGCGWGALAERMARAGARVTATTISNEQLAAARERIGDAGLEDEVEVRFEDYRLTSGTFDRIVSVEMIEAVGEENWPLFFKTVNERLAPGGVAVIQAITIREDAFAQYRENPDFIQRYIFPGGMLPTVALMRQRAGEQGLGFETVERFGLSYALTLADWRRRFEAAWPQIAKLGFDERFRRMWLYYLIYCEVGFERGLIDVGLYRLRKPDVD
jgi:cyclopropane-fatty-acyl-phospholipid synthase